MIITRYLVQEALKSQLAIVIVLFMIFFCQKLIKILSATINGEIPTNIMLYLLSLSIPEIMQLIIPMSLFLSLLIIFSKLYASNEITVMHACGLSKVVLIKSAMILAFFSGILTAVSVMWISPWSYRYQNKILAIARTNLPNMAALIQGRFQRTTNGNLVLFVKNVDGNSFHDFFFAQFCHKNKISLSTIIVADQGQFTQCKYGSQVLILNKGMRFERIPMLRNFRITYFQNYQAIIERHSIALDPDDIEQMNISTLWNTNTKLARAELHWRVTLIFTVFSMSLMVVPLIIDNPRQERVLSMLPAILLYLVFLILQILIKSNAGKEKIDPIIWMWVVNGVYLLLAVILNLRNILSIYYLQAYLYIRKLFNADI